jgi:hypothetical protein
MGHKDYFYHEIYYKAKTDKINPLETGINMTKEELLKKVKSLLKTNNDLDFLLALKKPEIETLIACIRDRLDNAEDR